MLGKATQSAREIKGEGEIHHAPRDESDADGSGPTPQFGREDDPVGVLNPDLSWTHYRLLTKQPPRLSRSTVAPSLTREHHHKKADDVPGSHLSSAELAHGPLDHSTESNRPKRSLPLLTVLRSAFRHVPRFSRSGPARHGSIACRQL